MTTAVLAAKATRRTDQWQVALTVRRSDKTRNEQEYVTVDFDEADDAGTACALATKRFIELESAKL